MTERRSIGLLSPHERRRALEAALVRMMARPESERPYVVLDHVRTGKFVQFCGSTSRALTFDVPELDHQVVVGHRGDPSVYSRAAAMAFEVLTQLVGASIRGELTLEESLAHDCPSN